MVTIKMQMADLEALARKVGMRGPMMLETLLANSDHAPEEKVEVEQPPNVPNATSTYGDRARTVNAPTPESVLGQPNAAVEGADPE